MGSSGAEEEGRGRRRVRRAWRGGRMSKVLQGGRELREVMVGEAILGLVWVGRAEKGRRGMVRV